MIFMSQSGLIDTARQAGWEVWYIEHLRIMRTVPGIASAQRFTTRTAGFPPSLAMYTVASEAVFRDPYYLSVRGMGEWKPLIDPRHYHRNLFDGLASAPHVPDDHVLIVADRGQPDPSLGAMTWLRSVGIDRSTPYRGIVAAGSDRALAYNGKSVAMYVPVAT